MPLFIGLYPKLEPRMRKYEQLGEYSILSILVKYKPDETMQKV